MIKAPLKSLELLEWTFDHRGGASAATLTAYRSRDQISSTMSWPYARAFLSSSRVKPNRW